jgi:PAS domain S-box-containing protein
LTDAIAAWVTSLGDFPLDPDAGSAWLWSGGGDRLLWASAAARAGMSPETAAAPADAALVRSFAPLLALAEPDREPIRVHQLAPGQGPRPQVHTCLCRHVPLRQGGFGLLAVAIGAPARSMAEVRGETADEPLEQQAPLVDGPEVDEAEAERAETAGTSDEPEFEAAPEPDPEVAPAAPPPEAPDWTTVEPAERSPIRFVWQTGPDGRFVHISRELAAAVGPGRAMVLGRTWEEAAAALGLEEGDGVAAGFRSEDTWTAPPVLWPVENADLGVPVEMAGLRVLEAGRFEGFRGYGIARIERAVERPRTAAEALATDAEDALREQEAVEPPARPRDLRRSPRQIEPPTPVAVPPEEAEISAAPDPSPAETLVAPAEPAPAGSVPPEPETATQLAQDPMLDEASIEISEVGAPKIDEPAIEDATTGDLMVDPASAHVEEPTVAAPPPSQPAADSTLSASEREAFREIAKALGAMTENLGRPASRPVAAQERPTPVPPMPERAKAARPLEIVRRDIVHLAPRLVRNAAAPADPRAPTQEVPPAPAPAVALLDALPAGLLVMRDGEALFANRPLLDLAGYPDLAALHADGGAARLFGRREKLPEASGRLDLTTRSGATKPADLTIQPIAWDGAPALLATVRPAQPAQEETREAPVVARMRALEMELRGAQSELRELRSVLDTATDGVILLDGEGRILSLNRSAEALFGYDQNEIAGEKLTLLLDQESHIAALDYLDGLKSNGVNSILNDGRDVRGRERNGGAIPLFMTIGRVGEREGGAKFCAVLRDVTHWKKVEADLLEAKRAAEDANAHKSDFLARISHEVRTPLNAIIGFSQVMMAESFGPIGNDRYRQYAKDIHASGEHVVSLVNDLLDLSKIAAGRLELTFGSVDVNAVVAGTVAMIQPQANANRVIVRSQLAQPLPSVVADERSLRQIMLNLLSNAARYTEAGGQVVASTSLSDRGEVVIRVSDTGIGMAEEEIRRAMEPFRQIPGPRSGGGTGLGLPLTKALVEANRAAFAIRSEPRKGTLVEVVFPSTRVLAE